MTLPTFVYDDLDRLGIKLSQPQIGRMANYLDLLLQANKQFNLTAVRDHNTAWQRHIIDSLTLLPALERLPERSHIIDLGSGGGLPGIPLAIARPNLHVILLEATRKKARFLQQCVDTLSLTKVNVINQRAEIIGQDPVHRQQYDVAVCRAIGAMNLLLEFALPLLKVRGQLFAMKGPQVETELNAAANAIDVLGAGNVAVSNAYPDGFDCNTVIVTITKVQPTPRVYPRRPGVPKQSPL